MSAKVSLQRVIQLELLQWDANTFYVMRKRGAWPWVVRCGGRLAIDVDALERFMREVAPPWAYTLRSRSSIQKLREAAQG